jgi:hypothetical protein
MRRMSTETERRLLLLSSRRSPTTIASRLLIRLEPRHRTEGHRQRVAPDQALCTVYPSRPPVSPSTSFRPCGDATVTVLLRQSPFPVVVLPCTTRARWLSGRSAACLCPCRCPPGRSVACRSPPHKHHRRQRARACRHASRPVWPWAATCTVLMGHGQEIDLWGLDSFLIIFLI